tara:strand:- start:1328 stop:1960 length:633 start_codon:yes stop_codon:yes gene_type:complete
MSEILIKRGTDAARRDGTLGTPAQGEPIYTTDDKNLWIGDGSTSGGLPVAPAALVTLYASTTQNINALATDNLMLWNLHQTPINIAQTGTATDLTHSNSTNKHLITVNVDCILEMAVSIAVDAASSTPTRWNGIARVVKGASTEIGGQGKGGYLREASGQDETSLHIPSFTYEFSSGDTFWVKVDRETSSASAAVDTTQYASTFFIRRLA